MSAFHPDLAIGRFIPRFSFGPRVVSVMSRVPQRTPTTPEDMLIDEITVPGAPGGPAVSLRVYRPRTLTGPAPALFWIHGGGFLQGDPVQDERSSIDFARTLGITVVGLRYRLGPEHPSPAAIEDAYAGLSWLAEHAVERGVDPERIAIGGASAGGGLAAALALYAHDRGEITPAFQLLVYPMLDDRTALRDDLDTRSVRIWTPGSNRYGWSSYLGTAPGGPGISPYAAPARRDDLSGLPPAWIGVGSLDLFLEEDLEYARRLREAGVPCESTVVKGAFHGFDVLFAEKPVSRRFWRAQAAALRGALFPAP
ncbi:alpha/beta hydrolase [Agreia sp. PsM10]|uniref:alpha/beta hydrolase n=1 Tax=Agreia sp. PsM10 TaxID=3030533 RepID=UPI00263A4FF4|nr:alpha/beta hydrolase [Agreia sp. PsM10]MDN4639869.1 alpha/beta hydrolase [Agreia sp. PsM10]